MYDNAETLEKEKMLNEFKKMQEIEDAQVFHNPGDETRSTLYGAPRGYAHLGFDSIEGFNEGISNLKIEIENTKEMLTMYQKEINNLNIEIDRLHPEDDFTDQIPKLTSEKEEIREKALKMKEQLIKEKSELDALNKAKAEFIKNKHQTNKSAVREKVNLLEERAEKEKELKILEGKIYAGTANNFEKERYEELKNNIIPEIDQIINHDKPIQTEEKPTNPEPEPITEEDSEDLEIIEEEDAPEIIEESKLKKILKKVAAGVGILGGAALIGAVIYNAVKQGDTETSQSMINTMSDLAGTVKDVGINSHIDPISQLTQQTNVGDVNEVFTNHINAMNGTNGLDPLEPWFQNDILGYTDTNGIMHDASTVQEIADAYKSGVDISAIQVGNESGIDGFVNTVNGQPLQEVLDEVANQSVGGVTR